MQNLALLLFVAGCWRSSAPEPIRNVASPSPSPIVSQPTYSLYDRIGGEDALAAIVEAWVGRIATDPRINAFFANADVPRLKAMLVDQLCAAADGPCEYRGKDMKHAHAGMGIRDAAFDAFVEDLVFALDQFHVPDKEKGELRVFVESMRGDIVTP